MAHAKRQAATAMTMTLDRATTAPTLPRNAVPTTTAPNLAALAAYDLPALRAAWCRLHRGATPPSLSHDLLLRDTAFRLQEIAVGGLRPATKRKLTALSARADDPTSTTSGARRPDGGASVAAGADTVGSGCGAGGGGAQECASTDEGDLEAAARGVATDTFIDGESGGENAGHARADAALVSGLTGVRRRERGATRTVTIQLKPGATLMRAWHGKTHTVQVTPDGYEYDGQRYGSLSLIAQQITGSHWSGPRFFGLVQRTPSEPSVKPAARPKPPARSGGHEHA